MNHFRVSLSWIAFLGSVAAAVPAGAQQPALNSHEVNPDRSVTIRYYAPSAREVSLSLDYDHHPAYLKKGADGVWTVTTGPLQPALHFYGLTVDGVGLLDPLNQATDHNFVFMTNTVRVPGAAPELWDPSDAAHGTVHHHKYRSAILQGLPDGLEDYYVYTPAEYGSVKGKTYPVLYLLHGWSSLSDSWLNGGQADVILDNLMAQGKARPMIVVMPLGYGDLTFVTKGFGQWSDRTKIGRNVGLFSDALMSEIIPRVEADYRVSRKPEDRAIAGLSMGGGQSLLIGLNHPETFEWIGGFSSGLVYDSFEGLIPNLGPGTVAKTRLLWIACGTEDDLVAANRKFIAWLKSNGIQPTAIETPGIHNWQVWRDNLIHFAPLLFKAP